MLTNNKDTPIMTLLTCVGLFNTKSRTALQVLPLLVKPRHRDCQRLSLGPRLTALNGGPRPCPGFISTPLLRVPLVLHLFTLPPRPRYHTFFSRVLSFPPSHGTLFPSLLQCCSSSHTSTKHALGYSSPPLYFVARVLSSPCHTHPILTLSLLIPPFLPSPLIRYSLPQP